LIYLPTVGSAFVEATKTGNPRFPDFGFNEVQSWVADRRTMTFLRLASTRGGREFGFSGTCITAGRGAVQGGSGLGGSCFLLAGSSVRGREILTGGFSPEIAGPDFMHPIRPHENRGLPQSPPR